VHSADAVSPERTAALVAPVIDRLRQAFAAAAREASTDLGSSVGLSEPGLLILAMLRNTMPDRQVTREQVRAVLRYMPVSHVDAGLAGAFGAAMFEGSTEETFSLSDRGRDVVERLYRLTSDVVCRLWAGHDERVARLIPIARHALDAATATGGPAFAVMSPPYEPANARPAMVLAELLTPLRFHRFDAHVAAWQAAGLTVADVVALPAGPERDRIEEETNRLAAVPYAALRPDERLEFLGGLGALPN
jgi:hypothetical protein